MKQIEIARMSALPVKLTQSLINGRSMIIYLINFLNLTADNRRHMFRLSNSKMNLESPSGQPLVSSPDIGWTLYKM